MTTETVKIYRIDDYDWVAAISLESAKAWYLSEAGMTADEAFDEFVSPYELTDEQMQSTTFLDIDGEFGGGAGQSYSFREALGAMLVADYQAPWLFASTEQ